MTTVQGQKVKGQGYVMYWQQERYKLAVDSHISFKLGRNYHRHCRQVLYTFSVSRSNKPEVEIWQTFSIGNGKKTAENVAKLWKFFLTPQGNQGPGIEW